VKTPTPSGEQARRRGYSISGFLSAAESRERPALLWAFSGFFSLLCGHYVIRPMRDEMGVAGGVEHLQWMFSATFIAMLATTPLFGWVTRRFAPPRFLPYVYSFFIAGLLLFYALFTSDLSGPLAARAFFVWASVFNLFVVSVFWSLMVDIFDNEQAKRLFGVIAAGGTAGAIAGPALTAVLVLHLGTANLLLLCVALLGWTALCTRRLTAWRGAEARQRATPQSPAAEAVRDAALGGSILAGIRLIIRSRYLVGICLLMLLFTTLATFLYFQQAQIVRDSFEDSAKRTAFFAGMDLAVNALTLFTQILLTARIVTRIGLDWALALVPIFLAGGFLLLGAAPGLAVIACVQVARRAGEYALTRPAREMLYTVLNREEKYKAKNVIDTVVYRGGDAVSAWVFAGLQAIGFSAGGISFLAVPLSLAWAFTGFRLGRRREQLAAGRDGSDINGERDNDRT
jgi:AAA family ATP:ADP antiporter